jgi:hypothetical protein
MQIRSLLAATCLEVHIGLVVSDEMIIVHKALKIKNL